jgi:hypothetical protein
VTHRLTSRRAGAALVLAALLALFASACDSGNDSGSGSQKTPESTRPAPPKQSAVFRGACAGTLDASTAGTLASPEMNEVSGLAVSAENPSTLWAHNDSGDIARVFAIAPTGALRGIYTLNGATALDWEDMAIGPGPEPETWYLYLGDIGDNAQARPNIVVYRVAEPDVVGDGGTYPLEGVDALTLQYPDGPHDAEALMVDPRSGELYIVIKHLAGGRAAVYRAPPNLGAGSTTVLERVDEVDLGIGLLNAVTAADISRDGSTIAVRTYGGVTLWDRGDRTVVAALDTKSCRGPIPFEIQGETLALGPGGRSYFTVSEGVNAPLHQFIASAPRD